MELWLPENYMFVMSWSFFFIEEKKSLCAVSGKLESPLQVCQQFQTVLRGSIVCKCSGYLIEYGHEAEPSILWVQIFLLAAPRDEDDDDDCCDDCRARQKL